MEEKRNSFSFQWSGTFLRKVMTQDYKFAEVHVSCSENRKEDRSSRDVENGSSATGETGNSDCECYIQRIGKIVCGTIELLTETRV